MGDHPKPADPAFVPPLAPCAIAFVVGEVEVVLHLLRMLAVSFVSHENIQKELVTNEIDWRL